MIKNLKKNRMSSLVAQISFQKISSKSNTSFFHIFEKKASLLGIQPFVAGDFTNMFLIDPVNSDDETYCMRLEAVCWSNHGVVAAEVGDADIMANSNSNEHSIPSIYEVYSCL